MHLIPDSKCILKPLMSGNVLHPPHTLPHLVAGAHAQVIMFDPMYDCYGSMCKRSGGVVVPVPLNPGDWSVPRDALRDAFTPRTKMLLVNTPHNPTGVPIVHCKPPR